MSNISSLTTLNLVSCSLYGEFPMDIFRLPKLQILNAGFNKNLTGSLPEFQSNSRLKALIFQGTGLYGKLPDSIGRLESLSSLDFSQTSLSGMLPSPIGNLTRLTFLDLYWCQFSGQIPSSLANLSQLTTFGIGYNDFDAGPLLLPPGKLLKLTHLYAPEMNLQVHWYSGARHVYETPIPGLGSCNLVEFPGILRFQDKLQMLIINNNKFQGKIPAWVWNSSKETMEIVDLHQNFLTGFDQQPAAVPWPFLKYFDFSSNKIQGSLPIPPPSLVIYDAHDNALTGAIPPSICHKNSLRLLDLSNNNLNGTIPPCLASSNEDLLILGIWKWASSWAGYWDNSDEEVSRMVCQDLWEGGEVSEEAEKEGPRT
ncbi:hypothetical protein C3L33_15123, partial [Rhododendron williamsianum]